MPGRCGSMAGETRTRTGYVMRSSSYSAHHPSQKAARSKSAGRTKVSDRASAAAACETRTTRTLPSRAYTRCQRFALATSPYGATTCSTSARKVARYLSRSRRSFQTACWMVGRQGTASSDWNHQVESRWMRCRAWASSRRFDSGSAADSLRMAALSSWPTPSCIRGAGMLIMNRARASSGLRPVRVVRYSSTSATPPPGPRSQ